MMKYSKRAFFPILFKIYKQMGRDLLYLPARIISFLVSPINIFRFYKKNSFKYGQSSLNKNDKPDLK